MSGSLVAGILRGARGLVPVLHIGPMGHIGLIPRRTGATGILPTGATGMLPVLPLEHSLWFRYVRGVRDPRTAKEAGQPTGCGWGVQLDYYFLRWRILDRIRRFLRPIFRRPFPVLFVPTGPDSDLA